MRKLLFTTGSPFARAVRIILDELGLEYERQEETATATAEERAAATPTLQVPVFYDGDLVLWESGVIAEYLLTTYARRKEAPVPLAARPWRPDAEWPDKLVFATIQTFGSAATTISQMRWSGVAVDRNSHLRRSAGKLERILDWLEARLDDAGGGFFPDCVSMQDIFLASHVRFVQARPLGVDLNLSRHGRIKALLDRLDRRGSFVSQPVLWWEPGVVGYGPDGTPVFQEET